MKKIFYILLIQLLIPNNFETIGTFTENSNSFESISMSGSTTAWIEGVSSIASNPAGLVKLKGVGIDVGLGIESSHVSNYGETQFPYFALGYGFRKPLIPGTDLYAAIGVSYQSRVVNDIEGWSVTQNYEGLFNFSESALSIAFALDLNPLSFGFKWVNYNQSFGRYGSQSSEEFFKPIGFGFQYDLTKNLKFGIDISKVSKIGTYDYSIGKSKAGISYKLNEKSFISADYEKVSNDNGNINIGYMNTFDKFSITTGLKNTSTNEGNYNNISFGMSYRFTDKMNFSFAMKQNIGSEILDPLSRLLYFSVGYKFSNKKE
jgi:hypothetical protein